MRVFSTRRWSVRAALFAVALAIVALIWPAPTHAQFGGGGMGGGMPGGGMPGGAMFGEKRKQRDDEVRGPSMSATDEPVAEIRIVGNKTIPTDQILNQLQTRVGRPFDPALVQRDVRKLYSRSWFLDIQPSYDKNANGRVVIFKVVERPVIRYVKYLGHKGIREKKLNKETDLKVGGSLDPEAVQEARRKLIDLYHRTGYNNVQIQIKEGAKPTDQGIVFIIHEGMYQKIWDVNFVGNEFVSGRRLKTQIESKPPLMMIFKGFVDHETVDADVDKLTAYYRSFGYFEAKIGRRIEFDENNKWATVTFVVHEGPRYDVQDVQFIGNKIFANTSLAMGLKMPSGQPFEQAKMNADVELLKEIYGSQGYVFADIQAEPIFLEEPGKLKLMYHIDEGKQWKIGNIFVHIDGDTPHTRIQTALNRLSFRSGQIADIREVKASERRLQASGLFLYDPIRGVTPKISYRIPELDDSKMANGKGSSSFRGQSPDGFGMELGIGSVNQSTPNPAPALTSESAAGPPLIAPPGSQTLVVQPPAGFVPSPEQVDVHLYFGNEQTGDANDAAGPPLIAPPASPPTSQVYEAHRFPYEDTGAPTNQPPVPGATSDQRPTLAGTPANADPYQRLIVRTQSPYQPATTTTPAPTAPTVADRYSATTYGGQAVGATSPNAVPAGGNPYATRQAPITQPQYAQAQPAAASSYAVAQNTTTLPFGPPPLPAPQQVVPGAQEALPAPPYAAPQQVAPQPQYGPAPQQYFPGRQLPPDPAVAPLDPQLRNPQMFPATPTGPFTPYPDNIVDVDVGLSENQTGRLMVGAAVNSDAGLTGQILLDEQNFDWTRWPSSWDEFASGRAFRGAGQRFRIEAAPGTEVQRYLVSFQEPYLWDTPVSLGLSGSFFDRRYLDYDEQRIGGRVSLGYNWTENDLSAVLSYRGENVNIRNISNPAVPELTEVLGSNALHGFKLTLANDTRDNAFLATQGHLIQLELEQVIGSFDYPRAILDGRQYFLLRERPDHSGRHVLTAASRVGVTGSHTPIYENFFAGGFSTLRGFDFRGASPVVLGVQVGGEFEFLNTLEYLFPLTADDMMHGVIFTDFGTVTPSVEMKDFRVSPGFGLRITVPAMGPAPIALDFAFPVLKADTDDEQVFSFFIGLQR